ncbi:MAG: hypothetical protein WC811_14130 [Hyphomicrobium sp.]|jgi:hypothetical protein
MSEGCDEKIKAFAAESKFQMRNALPADGSAVNQGRTKRFKPSSFKTTHFEPCRFGPGHFEIARHVGKA